jgi:hypothetical protein
MAYGFGSTVNPQLGATNYSGFLQGALTGAQMQAQGGAAIAQGLQSAIAGAGAGVKKYLENKETNAMFDSLLPRITGSLEKNQFLREQLNITDPSDRGQIKVAAKVLGDGNLRKGLTSIGQLLAEEARAGRESAAVTGAMTDPTAAETMSFREMNEQGVNAGSRIRRSPSETFAKYTELGGRNAQLGASLAGIRQSERALTSAEKRADAELRQQEAAAKATGQRLERQMRLEEEKAAEQVRQFNTEYNRKVEEAKNKNYEKGYKETIDIKGTKVVVEWTGGDWLRASDKMPLMIKDPLGASMIPNPAIYGAGYGGTGGSFADDMPDAGGSIADANRAIPAGPYRLPPELVNMGWRFKQ